MEQDKPKYEISFLPYYLGFGLIMVGLIWFFAGGYTLEDAHTFVSSHLKNKKTHSIAIIVLVVIGIGHAILSSLKKNMDSYGIKNPIDIYVWLSSTFTVIGTGFLAFTTLKIFCGLLGEAFCGIPFLFNKDGFVLWPFMVITFIALLYCAIKIGAIVGEIIELARLLFHSKTEEPTIEELLDEDDSLN